MKRILILLKVVVSISLLIYLFWDIDLNQFFQILYGAKLHLVFAAAFLYLGSQYLSAYRWQVLLIAQEISVSVHKLFSFYLVGMFFNNFLPTSMGGDAIKGIDLYRYSGKGGAAIATVFLERYAGIVAMTIIGLLSLIVGYVYRIPDQTTALLLVGMGTAIAGGTLTIANRHVKVFCLKTARRFGLLRAEKIATEIYEAFVRYKVHKRLFLYAILLSFGIQSLNIFVYILLSEAIGLSVPWGYFFLFYPIVTVVAMLPLSFNGLGMREGMMVYLFSKVGVLLPQILGLSLAWFFSVTIISFLGGLVFVLRKPMEKSLSSA